MEKKTNTNPVAELHHLGDDLLVDTGEDGISDELHVFAGERIHKHLRIEEEEQEEFQGLWEKMRKPAVCPWLLRHTPE